MRYKYISTIDRAWKGKIWLAGFPKLLTEEEAKQKYITPYCPRRVILKGEETLKQYCEKQKLTPQTYQNLINFSGQQINHTNL